MKENSGSEKTIKDANSNQNNSLSFGKAMQEAFIMLKGKMLIAFVSTFVYITPLILSLFIPYVGVLISALLFGHLTVGYVEQLKNIIKGEKPSLLNIYKNRPNVVVAVFVGVLYIAMVLLGFTLFIVPVFVVFAYFGLIFNIIQSNHYSGIKNTFKASVSINNTKKLVLLSYKIVFVIAYLFVMLIAFFASGFIIVLYSTASFLAIALFALLALIIYSAIIFITMFSHSTDVVFYNSITETVKQNSEIVAN